MSPLEIAEETIREIWAIHDFLAKLGFDFSDVFVGNVVDKTGENGIGVILRSQGKQAVFACGRTGVETDEFTRMWTEYLDKHNAREISDEEKQFVVDSSWIGSNYISAVSMLMKKGFELSLPQEFKTAVSFMAMDD